MTHARTAWTFLAGLSAVFGLSTGCREEGEPPPPGTLNLITDVIRQTASDKIDLLFVIDNSSSMADKQALLSKAIPALLEPIINPPCVNQANPALIQPGPGATACCPEGYSRAHQGQLDLHLGVITSSLGAHGGQYCDENVPVGSPPAVNPMLNDRAHLLGTTRPRLYSFQGAGFLAWTPRDRSLSDHERNGAVLTTDLTNMVTQAGETGCSYPATLESWYRFLIDPHPAARIELNAASGQAELVGEDTELLQQRKAFLRPDSMVVIIMVSDRNDCSIVDGGKGWFATSSAPGLMSRATSACTQEPNSPCCRPCSDTVDPAGCPPAAQDPECQKGALSSEEDPPNLRCWQQKRRFGLDLLYPTSRYVNGLSSNKGLEVPNPDGSSELVPNPLYSDLNQSGAIVRDPSLVFLVGIIGVPWQDVATPESRMGPGLKYLHASELGAVWPMILGDPASGVNPTDPLMIETPTPRSGNSLYGGPMAPENSPTVGSPQANSINGHEYHAVGDLQYACIFPLETPRDCTTVAGDTACDCKPGELNDPNGVPFNKPVCQPPTGGPAGTTQYFAKAYPGLRQLQVLKDYGSNSIVASICPKETTGTTLDPSFGYNPTLYSIFNQGFGTFKERPGGRCLPRPLSPDAATGLVPCVVVEVTSGSGNCDCSSRPGRNPEPLSQSASDERLVKLDAWVRDSMKNDLRACDKPGKPACSSYCLCEIQQASSSVQTSNGESFLDACRRTTDYCESPTAPDGTPLAGYCYVDDPASPLLQNCAPTEKQLLAFVGPDTPFKGATIFIACASFHGADGGP